jgi:hypothetical protein
MKYQANTPEEYAAQLTDERRLAVEKLRETLKQSLPQGIEETMYDGMIGYVIPLSLYPRGYHAKKGEPLPFMSIASQKNYITYTIWASTCSRRSLNGSERNIQRGSKQSWIWRRAVSGSKILTRSLSS